MSEKWILNERFNVKKDQTRKGGTATVYKAIDIENGNHVAVKVFDNSDIKKELTLEAYQRDLKSLQDLNGHPHIAQIIDFGQDESTGNHFIVMEWLETSLLEEVNSHEITCWDDFYTHYGRPILEALSFSHKRDIVHRDVKPGNILFSSDGKLKLVDFGISKYKIYWGANVTFLGWSSKPYSPPEDDNFQYINTRDIYGFAALSLACLERRDLDETENLIELISNHSLDGGVADILEACLSFNPVDRIQSIEELIDCLNRFCSSAQRVGSDSSQVCYLSLTNAAIQVLQKSTGNVDRSSIERHVARELNEACSFERENNGAYLFCGIEHVFKVVIDDITKSHFVVVAVHRKESWVLENIRERNYIPNCNFIVSRPPKSESVRQSTIQFLDSFSDWEANAEERNRIYQERILVDLWKAQLRLQLDLEKIAQDEVFYSSFTTEDERITFNLEAGDWNYLVGQERFICCDKRKMLSFCIDGASNDQISSRLERVDPDGIPAKGKLTLDTRLQAISRIRQEVALDDILFDRAFRSDLKKLIFDPSKSSRPQSFSVKSFFQDNLDQAKKEIVNSALGLEDFLVVNGPPGTGKTKLIAEIVLQELERDPKSKILVTSQTHNAIDNALERIRELKSDDQNLRAVRIGRRDDSRISNGTKDLLLDGLVATWLANVKQRATSFLDEWSEKNNVDKKEVELGLAVRSLRLGLEEYRKLLNDRESLQMDIDSLEEAIKKMKSNAASPSELSLPIFNRDKSLDNLRELDERIVRTRRSYRDSQAQLETSFPDWKDLPLSSPEELHEWEKEFLSASTTRERCKDVIELLQDWFDRFGRSSDFNAAFLSEADIVSATCIGIGLKSYKNINFDICIIDEASKATPTETFLPLVKSKRWVLIGDPQQLPPYVQDGARSTDLLSKHNISESDLKSTLMDRLIKMLPEDNIKYLNTQYRMCPQIGNLISYCFYDEGLKTGRGNPVDFEKLLAIAKPVTWYSTSKDGSRFEIKHGKSYINRCESHYIAILLKKFNLAAKTLGKRFSVCVLSFYSSQENVLRSEVARLGPDCSELDITCGTVDSFQGRESDICIVSITRSNKQGNLGFVDDVNRINVALSRGKEALAIIGDSDFCHGASANNALTLVLEYIRSNENDCALVSI